MRETVYQILMKFYSEKESKKKLQTQLRVNKRGYTIANLLKKYDNDVEKVTEIYSEYLNNRKRVNTLEGNIERYGEIDGLKKYLEKNSKLSVSEKSLKLNGKTDDEIQRIRKTHSEKSANSPENFKSRYGENWEREWEIYCQKMKDTCPWGLKYWTDRGLSKEESELRVSELQKRDFPYFQKLGWSRERYIDLVKRRLYTQPTGSKIQKEFAQLLFESLSDDLKPLFKGEPITDSHYIFFKPNEHDIKMCFPDIVLKNIICEFDGVYWHSSDEAQSLDNAKNDLWERMGYSVFRITDEEFTTNKENAVNLAKNFILNNIEMNFSMRKI